MDVDSSFNNTKEDLNIEDEKRTLKNRNFPEKLRGVTDALDKLNTSPEESDELVVVGFGQGKTNNMANDDPVDFEDENAADGAKALEYSRTLVMEFNQTEVEFWFIQLENEMFTCGVKSQWMKRCILVKNLPAKIQNDVKSLLILKQTQAPADIYKQIKNEVLRIHAPKREDNFKKALTRVMVGLPSQLGQQLIDDICQKSIKLDGCCCAGAVYTLFCIQLPVTVRCQIADMEFNKETYQKVFQTADKIFLSSKTTEMSAGVAAVVVTDKAEKGESVAAVSKPQKGQNGGGGKPWWKNKSNRGNSNSGSGAGAASGTQRIRHKSKPPAACCDNHYRWADSAWFCLEPLTCPFVNKCKARPDTKKND